MRVRLAATARIGRIGIAIIRAGFLRGIAFEYHDRVPFPKTRDHLPEHLRRRLDDVFRGQNRPLIAPCSDLIQRLLNVLSRRPAEAPELSPPVQRGFEIGTDHHHAIDPLSSERFDQIFAIGRIPSAEGVLSTSGERSDDPASRLRVDRSG